MASPIPQVVFFDIGHTLVESPERSARRLLGDRLRLTDKEVARAGKLIMTHPATQQGELVDPLVSALPGRDPGRVLDALEAVWLEQQNGARAVEGANDLLEALRGMGIQIGFVSNIWHPFYQSAVAACPLLGEENDLTFLSYRSGIKKPAPELFQRAVAAAGVPPSACWMVGDVYELDMAPALGAGLRTIWLLRRPELERTTLAGLLRRELPMPDTTVETIDEVRTFLERSLQ